MARLNGAQEVPPIATRARGTLDLRIDDDSQMITFELTYAGIEGGAANASHIHFAPRRVNGGVSAFSAAAGPSRLVRR